MKKIILVFIISCIALSACQESTAPVDIDAEKDAIMKVIQNESEFARDGKFEEFKDLYIHDDLNTRIILRSDSLSLIRGWDNISKHMSYLEEREMIEDNSISVTKENPIIKITGNTAWLVCDNIWQGVYEGEEIYSESLQITFLEKIEGEWKVSLAAWAYKPDIEGQDETDDESEDEEEVVE